VLDYLQEYQMITIVCISATDGFLELLNAEKMNSPFDIVVIDEHFSGLSVDELISAIRAEKSLEKTFILCVREDNKVIDDGCSVIVTVPVTNEKLQHAFMYVLNAKRSGEGIKHKVIKGVVLRQTRHTNILLAEDNLINQKVVRKILEMQGHTVDIAANGEQAISLLEKKPYDLAIVDLQMPDVGGIDVINHFRATHIDEAQMPFMILTANATTEAINLCDELGVSAYLTKPVRSSHLLEVVNRVLGIEKLNLPADTLLYQPSKETDSARNLQVLDHKTLGDLERLSKDPEFMPSMTASFIRDSDALLATMQKSLEEGDLHRYRDCAHAIADNASGVGAFSLRAACTAITGIDQSEFKMRGIELLAKISSTYTVTCQALSHYLQQRHV
jgi:two-component system sensor histidine kinase RpfC